MSPPGNLLPLLLAKTQNLGVTSDFLLSALSLIHQKILQTPLAGLQLDSGHCLTLH